MSEERRIDRRVIKTRKAILDAFMRLVATTPYDKITISSLARVANIDRKTFYLHYASIAQLLEDVMAWKINGMMEKQHGESSADDESLLNFLTRINHAFHSVLVDNSPLLKNLSSDAVLEATRNVLMKMVMESPHAKDRNDSEQIALAAAFFLGGVVGAYRHALANEPDRPFERISREIEMISLAYIQMKVTELGQTSNELGFSEGGVDARQAAYCNLNAVRI